MIICHSKQVNFWKIPRTGSTTVEAILRLMPGVLDYDAGDIVSTGHFFPTGHHNVPGTVPPSINGSHGNTRTHLTPENAIQFGCLTQAQYDSYDNYCIVRDPLARLVSAHILGFSQAEWNVADILEQRCKPNLQYAIFKPQIEWLTLGNMNILPFSDYENSVTTILTAFGCPIPVDIPQITHRHPNWESRHMQHATATGLDRQLIEAPDSPYHEDSKLNH